MLHVSIKKSNSRIEVAKFSLLQKHKTLKPLMDCKSETTSKVSLTFTSRVNLGRRAACAEPSTLDTAHRLPHPKATKDPWLPQEHTKHYPDANNDPNH